MFVFRVKHYFCILGFFIMINLSGIVISDKTVIVVGNDAVISEKTAAKELQHYLNKITGGKLILSAKIPESGNCIVVGTGNIARSIAPSIDFLTLKPDEIILKTIGSNILLVSGDCPRGTLYAVFELLEKKFNVRFLSPSHEIIHRKQTTDINNLDYRYAPQFVYREAHSQPLRENTIWPVKMRLNGCRFRRNIPDKWGGFYQIGLDHSLTRKYVNAQKWFKKKPEWFALRKKTNKRVSKQLCLSNPEVVAQLIKDVLTEQEKMPSRRFIGIGAADNDKYCQCEKCMKAYQEHGSTGATMWLASNALAKELQKKYPETQIVYMAYWSTERPPEKLKVESNISVVLAMIDRNHGLPPSATPRHDIYLKKFNKLTNNKVYIWDYYANFRNFLMPTPNLSVIHPALRTYKRNRVKGIFAQLPFGTLADFLDYRNYLFAKLAWNPDLDSEKLKNHFFKDHYGKAADTLLQYMGLLNNARDRQKGTWIGCYHENISHWFKTEDILKANALVKRALDLTASCPETHKRVRAVYAGIVLININRYKEIRSALQEKGIKLKSREALIDELEALGKEFKCRQYSERGSFSKLIKKLRKKDTSKIIKVDSKPETHVISTGKLQGQYTKIHNGIAISPSQQIRTGFHWLDLKFGIYYELAPELEGIWNVIVTLRCTPQNGSSPAAAYLGIYAPHEICRQTIVGTEGDTSWQKINLGKFYLSKGSKIWIMPGVIKYSPNIEVKSIELNK